LHSTKDDGNFKEEKQIDEVLMGVFFLAFAFVGYLLIHLL
jgi:hypothetical protein